MARTALEMLREIATAASSAITHPWGRISIESQVDDELAEVTLTYVDPEGEVKWLDDDEYFAAAGALCTHLLALRKLTGDDEKGHWSKCNMTVHSDGEFSTDFSYDPPHWSA